MHQIDFFELAFLAEVCIPPVPIARASFWQKLIDVHYHNLTPEERSRLLDWLTRRSGFDMDNTDCALFYARYDPINQYIVTMIDGQEQLCFEWQGEMHIDSRRFIPKENIASLTDAPLTVE